MTQRRHRNAVDLEQGTADLVPAYPREPLADLGTQHRAVEGSRGRLVLVERVGVERRVLAECLRHVRDQHVGVEMWVDTWDGYEMVTAKKLGL